MHKLAMRFLTSTEGKYFTLTVDDIKADGDGVPTVTEAEVNALMDLVIAKNIFASANGNLIGKKAKKAYLNKGAFKYMNFYFAPMEGLTGYIYRNAHNAFFNNIDKYFSPFIVANQSESFKTRELNDILPENNQGIVLIPQLLTNNAKDFIHTSKKIKRLGYNEINLNLGCPSGTVVSKNRGSGFLSKREELDVFLEEIFSQAITKISVKTRIGKDQARRIL